MSAAPPPTVYTENDKMLQYLSNEAATAILPAALFQQAAGDMGKQ